MHSDRWEVGDDVSGCWEGEFYPCSIRKVTKHGYKVQFADDDEGEWTQLQEEDVQECDSVWHIMISCDISTFHVLINICFANGWDMFN